MQARADRAGTPALLSADRLASLSDTMFGVAMTLVATTLVPAIQAHRGSVLDMLPAMQGELITVVLSFAISGRYWISQQHRLAMTAEVTPRQTLLHLVFLFLVILVPITTSLPGLGGAGAVRDSVLIYGGHLALIALLNLLLWVEVHRNAAAHQQVLRSGLAFVVFVVALPVGDVWPDLTLYIWLTALAAPALSRVLARRWGAA